MFPTQRVDAAQDILFHFRGTWERFGLVSQWKLSWKKKTETWGESMHSFSIAVKNTKRLLKYWLSILWFSYSKNRYTEIKSKKLTSHLPENKQKLTHVGIVCHTIAFFTGQLGAEGVHVEKGVHTIPHFTSYFNEADFKVMRTTYLILFIKRWNSLEII